MGNYKQIQEFEPLWGIWNTDSLIGEGSFGSVYRAVRKDFDEEYYCAIKHISVPRSPAEVKQYLDDNMSTDTSAASEYFNHVVRDVVGEITAMYSLKGNTNIVSYEEHLVLPKEDGVGYDIFIKMEYLTDLTRHLGQAVITQQDVVKMGVDICTALEVCEAKNLIHRDVKPQNIFVSAEGNYKLGDFGISRRLEKTSGGLSKKGTYSYMAPEVYRGEEYGASVDIYSLGLVLYRLLNGNRLPFLPLAPTPVRYDDNEKALKRRISGEALPAPAFASPGLAEIIVKMCAYDRDKRYSNATEVKRALLALKDLHSRVIPVVAPAGQPTATDNDDATSATVSAVVVGGAPAPRAAAAVYAPPPVATAPVAQAVGQTAPAYVAPQPAPQIPYPQPAEATAVLQDRNLEPGKGRKRSLLVLFAIGAAVAFFIAYLMAFGNDTELFFDMFYFPLYSRGWYSSDISKLSFYLCIVSCAVFIVCVIGFVGLLRAGSGRPTALRTFSHSPKSGESMQRQLLAVYALIGAGASLFSIVLIGRALNSYSVILAVLSIAGLSFGLGTGILYGILSLIYGKEKRWHRIAGVVGMLASVVLFLIGSNIIYG